MTPLPIHGRGASINPPNRFVPLYREAVAGWTEEDDPAPRTRFYRDTSRTVLTTNTSPDNWASAAKNSAVILNSSPCLCGARAAALWPRSSSSTKTSSTAACQLAP